MRQEQKMNSNRYMPGFINVTFSICNLVKEMTNPTGLLKLYVDNYDPGLLETYKSLIHPCPYLVS
jgi:hypothetical protein